jgi:hypothetical protein
MFKDVIICLKGNRPQLGIRVNDDAYRLGKKKLHT